MCPDTRQTQPSMSNLSVSLAVLVSRYQTNTAKHVQSLCLTRSPCVQIPDKHSQACPISLSDSLSLCPDTRQTQPSMSNLSVSLAVLVSRYQTNTAKHVQSLCLTRCPCVQIPDKHSQACPISLSHSLSLCPDTRQTQPSMSNLSVSLAVLVSRYQTNTAKHVQSLCLTRCPCVQIPDKHSQACPISLSHSLSLCPDTRQTQPSMSNLSVSLAVLVSRYQTNTAKHVQSLCLTRCPCVQIPDKHSQACPISLSHSLSLCPDTRQTQPSMSNLSVSLALLVSRYQTNTAKHVQSLCLTRSPCVQIPDKHSQACPISLSHSLSLCPDTRQTQPSKSWTQFRGYNPRTLEVAAERPENPSSTNWPRRC